MSRSTISASHPTTIASDDTSRSKAGALNRVRRRRKIPVDQIVHAAGDFANNIEAVLPPTAAARAALTESTPNDLILITGSFYLIGDVDRTVLSE